VKWNKGQWAYSIAEMNKPEVNFWHIAL